MHINQSRANLDMKILYGKNTHLSHTEMMKMLVSGNDNSTFDSVPRFSCQWFLNSISEIDNCIDFIFQWQENCGPNSSIKCSFSNKPVTPILSFLVKKMSNFIKRNVHTLNIGCVIYITHLISTQQNFASKQNSTMGCRKISNS